MLNRPFARPGHMVQNYIYTGEQIAQWDFQNNAPAFVLEVPCATCSPVYIILYHVTGSCKGPIASQKTTFKHFRKGCTSTWNEMDYMSTRREHLSLMTEFLEEEIFQTIYWL